MPDKNEILTTMAARIREEAAKFPRNYVSPLKNNTYGDGPMSTTTGIDENFGVCGCLNYWSCELFHRFDTRKLVQDDRYSCSVNNWPPKYRAQYKRCKTVRGQYLVMAKFLEAGVTK
jgi:hypothetical protein